jgi:TetR/AcrR family transcriptional repressor of nem operon
VTTRWKSRSAGTADLILDTAERLVQTRGFNAFSYADVSEALGIRKASLHHHFATKAELGAALIGRYRRGFGEALRAIEQGTGDARQRLERYVELYRSVLRKRRMCLCGMLASDVDTLPSSMRTSVATFFSENEAWLAGVLEEGRKSGVLGFDGGAASFARFLVSSLEGAMLVSRGGGGTKVFDSVAQHLLAEVERRPARRSTRARGSRVARGPSRDRAPRA